MKTRTANIPIAQIRRDGGTQIRAALDESTVADYAALIKDVSQYNLPSVVVYFDGADHWLSDGFHRIEAALRAGAVRTPCEVRNGTQRDAILAACGANAEHGLRRSHADKRNAVATLLDDPEWATWKDRAIARAANVDHGLVAKMREERRAATSEKLRPVAAGGVALTPLSKGLESPEVDVATAPERSRQPAPGHGGESVQTPSEVRRESSGDEGAGALADASITAPAPDEPRAPSIDLAGLDDIDPAWLELTDDVVAALDAFHNHLCQAQGYLHDLLSSPVGAQLQALRKDAHDLTARARKAIRPKSVCLYCKDPDGTAGRRDKCNGCRGLGWLTEEQLGAVPRELTTKGEAAKVIDVERGGYVPRKQVVDGGRSPVAPHSFVNCACGNRSCAYCNSGLCLACGKGEPARAHGQETVPRARALKIELVDEAGATTAFEGDEDESGPSW